jgi:putative peptide modification system cyclase
MNLRVKFPSRSPVGSAVTPLLRAVLLADLVDSTAFIQSFGDARAAVALQRLDLQIRDLLEFTGGRLIDKADGLLAIFERPIQAVDFALRYQQALRQFSANEGTVLNARIGIHVGELMTWSNTDHAVAAGAKPLEVEGLAKPVAARLMSLALPGQILISSMAQSLAQRAQAELGDRADRVRWHAHGRYRFKGVPAPLLVHEIGEAGFAPMRPPPSGQKAWRELPLWRRPPVLAAEMLLFVAVSGFYAYTVLRSPPAIAFQERDWVVVGDMSNFTGDPRLEESLDTALRISLEQSRFVNLVPELKVQEVLQRMGRSPEATVDRAIGSEIALREGARALLLPTVAEVGGRLRVSMELVDPNTQVTVFAETAEGRGAESALASIDTINGKLRERLGESLGDISANDKPLAEVTTSSLDALRFYSLANEAVVRSKFSEAVRLLSMAIEKDPQFALAYANRAELYALVVGDNASAKTDYQTAERHKSRLTMRETLDLDANLASFGPPGVMLEKLDVISRAYPDSFSARRRAAQLNWAYLQQYPRALETLHPALKSQNPRLASAMYLVGMLNLAQENYVPAEVAFNKYESLGGRGFNRDHADLYAAKRQFGRAERVLRQSDETGVKAVDLEMRLSEVTYPLDQGRWQEALVAASTLRKASSAVSKVAEQAHGGLTLGLLTHEQGAKVLPEWRRFVVAGMRGAVDPENPDVFPSRFAALYGSSQLAKLGDAKTAQAVLDQLSTPVAESGYPTLMDMTKVLEAELALAENHPKAAIAVLRSRLLGSELCIVHSVLLRAYLQANLPQEAMQEAVWLSSHRGRAYVEWNSERMLQPVNVLESNLAILSRAELAEAAGDSDRARELLGEFAHAWRKPPGFVAERVLKLKAAISLRKSQRPFAKESR